mmetsp:Transcript_10825/g.22925  ORF Transcript_10825/g.22925 Transcript_10825/m.22925 type:complete len:132 (-) Transcript_10825:175-570(-)
MQGSYQPIKTTNRCRVVRDTRNQKRLENPASSVMSATTTRTKIPKQRVESQPCAITTLHHTKNAQQQQQRRRQFPTDSNVRVRLHTVKGMNIPAVVLRFLREPMDWNISQKMESAIGLYIVSFGSGSQSFG